MKKRILFISQRVPFPANKGEKIRTFHQIETLRNKGFEVTIAFLSESSEDDNYGKALSEALNCNVYTHHFSLPRPLRLASAFFRGTSLSEQQFSSAHLKKWLHQHLDDYQYDAVLITASSLLPYLECINNKLKGTDKLPTLLVDFMDVDSDKWRQYAQHSKGPMRYLYQREASYVAKLEKDCITLCNEAYLIAEAEVDVFNRTVMSSEKLKVMGNGLDSDTFTPASEEKDYSLPILLFTGVMDYKPNVDAVRWFIRDVWPVVKEALPNAEFIIGGMNPVDEIKNLNGKNGIEVTGFVDDIMPYFHKATMFVAPFQIARGVQNKVLQAFSCALPVVTTPMGAEGIHCTNNEDVIIADSASSFAQAVIAMARDKEKSAAIGAAARELIVQHYSWQSRVAPLINKLNAGEVE
ncbi:TIGR03087 family PEP-CTERM/XrtA system glycosyltransferase [Alteromonas sp. H39]|uniref:TIGR03087 family PEP-CTERM/XrtA system glycosyltransferase n=1 Tax=Alteromonas sp. H39 TaxID=3389876 RepID=UPI0039DFF4C7